MTVSITQVSPPTANATAWTPVVIDVTTTNNTTYTYIAMTAGTSQVLVWGDGSWNPLFATHSTRTELIANKSYRYTLLPNTGWTTGFSLDVRADEADIMDAQAQWFGNTPSRYMYANGVYLGADFERTEPFTLFAFFRGGVGVTTRLLIDHVTTTGGDYRGYDMYVDGSGHVWGAIYQSGAGVIYAGTTGINVADNTWHSAAITYDGSSSVAGLIAYADGDDSGRSTSGTTLSTTIKNSSWVYVGQRPLVPDAYLEGYLYSPAIYSRVLTKVEIGELTALRGRNLDGHASYSDCLAWWEFGILGTAGYGHNRKQPLKGLQGYQCLDVDLSISVP